MRKTKPRKPQKPQELEGATMYTKKMVKGDKFRIETGDTVLLFECMNKKAEFTILALQK